MNEAPQLQEDEARLMRLQAEVRELERTLKERRESQQQTENAKQERQQPATDERQPSASDLRYLYIEGLTAIELDSDQAINLPSWLFHEMLYYNFITGKQQVDPEQIYSFFLRIRPGQEKQVTEAVDGYLAYLTWRGALAAGDECYLVQPGEPVVA